ncbi:MAG: hypothetical protein ACTHK7_08515 [Aureliella sp.]
MGQRDPHFGNNGELAFATSNDGRYANYGAIRLGVDQSQNVFLFPEMRAGSNP